MNRVTRTVQTWVKRALNITDDRLVTLWRRGNSEVISGEDEGYQSVSDVFACVSLIADKIAATPLRLLDAGGKPVNSAKLAKWQAEPYEGLDWQRWLAMVAARFALYNCVRIVRDSVDPWQMLPVSPQFCTPTDETQLPARAYYYTLNIGKIPTGVILADRVLSIIGGDPVQYHDATSGAEASRGDWQSSFLAQQHMRGKLDRGASIDTAYTIDRPFPDEATADKFTKDFQKQFEGAKSSGSIPVVATPGTGKFEKLGLTVVELALPEMIAKNTRQIAKAFRVPPSMIGEADARYKVEQALVMLDENCLEPKRRAIASEFTRALARDLGGDHFEFAKSESSLVAAWRAETSRVYIDGAVNGVLSPNEARSNMGLPAGTGEAANSLRVPMLANLEPLGVPPPQDAGQQKSRTDVNLERALAALMYPVKTIRADDKVNGRSREYRAAKWNEFDRTVGNSDKGLVSRYAKELNGRFKALKATLGDELKAHWPSNAITYDRATFDEACHKTRTAWVKTAWATGGDMGATQVSELKPGKSVRRDYSLSGAVADEIRRRAQHWTDLTGDETFNAVESFMQQGVKDGLGLQQMMDGLESLAELSPVRSERIARTEVISSLNAGQMDAYRQSGEVNGKEWLSVQDDRTRGNDPKDEFSHVGADGETVDLDSPFTRTGESLDCPGDFNGSPGNIINCRCTTLPTVNMEGY